MRSVVSPALMTSRLRARAAAMIPAAGNVEVDADQQARAAHLTHMGAVQLTNLGADTRRWRPRPTGTPGRAMRSKTTFAARQTDQRPTGERAAVSP